jgi:hypothetical protein
MTKNLKLFLSFVFFLQIIIASGFELSHDEAYYWLFSKHLDWGYFDHPPFVAFMIKLFSFLPKSELTVRIGFIFAQLTSLLILLYLTSSNLTCMLLFFSFPLASFSGLFALPDTPLLLTSALYIFQLKRYLENDSNKNSIILGIIISSLIYSKYHGIIMVFLTIVAVPKLFLRKSFYITAVFSVMFLLPHFWWQYLHGFPSIQYQLFERPSSDFSVLKSFKYILTEIFLAGFLVGPIVWFITLKFKPSSAFERSLKFISIGTIIFFLISSFSKKTEANWSVFLTVPLIFLVHSSNIWNQKFIKKLLWASSLTVIFSRILLILPPETFSIRRLNEFNGWRTFSIEVQKKCSGLPILANSYQIASKLSYYLDLEIGALNYHSRRNQFDIWMFDLKLPNNNVCYITDKKGFVGETIYAPDGKTLQIVKNMSIEGLRELKLTQR